MVINLEHNRYPKGLAPLEDTFSLSDASKFGASENKFSKTIDEVDQLNIGTKHEPKNINLSKCCSDEEKEEFRKLFHEF